MPYNIHDFKGVFIETKAFRKSQKRDVISNLRLNAIYIYEDKLRNDYSLSYLFLYQEEDNYCSTYKYEEGSVSIDFAKDCNLLSFRPSVYYHRDEGMALGYNVNFFRHIY